MLAGKVSMYLNGHTHALKHYRINSETGIDFFTTGAGCMVHTHDQDVCLGASCPAESAESHRRRRKYRVKEVFYEKASGFTAHTFSEDFSMLTTKALDVSGNVLHSFVTAKRSRTNHSTVDLVV